MRTNNTSKIARAALKSALGSALALVVVAMAFGPALARQKRVPKQQVPQVGNWNGNRLNVQRGWNQQMARPAQQVAGTAIHEPFEGPLTARAIRQAIDDGMLFLRSQQAEDGSIGEGRYHRGGPTVLAALAMLAAGANPHSDRALRRALDWLLALEQADNTYLRGIRANVWEYALRKVPHDERFRSALKADFEWLVEAFEKNGRAWRYNMRSTDWDNSCTQYGVLGIWAGQRAGFTPPKDFWGRISEHFTSVQNADGGYGYVQNGNSTPNMATAGLASMFLVFDMHHGRSFYSKENPRTFAEGDAAAVLEGLEKAMHWLGESKGDKDNSYYLYGIERAGVASGRKYFGGEDWFKRGAEVALTRQAANGSIPMGYSPSISTSLVTLFLVYGGAPVAFNKLEYGEGQDWNLNPRDLANVAKYLWNAYERPMNWHVVSIDDPVEEFEAPVLFISGSKAAKLSDGDVEKLRAYVQRGGTLFAEPSDKSPAFAKSMEALVKRIDGSAELADVGSDHGVFTVLRHDWKTRPKLRGASDGVRTWFFLSDSYLSANWQMNQTESDAFPLAMNLMFYATDLAALPGRFSSVLPDGKAVQGKGTVTVAQAKHAGDWNVASQIWPVMAQFAGHTAGLKVEDRGAVSLAGEIKDVDVLHLSGRGPMMLNASERASLKAFVKGGGTVVVDAWAGDSKFGASARVALSEIFGALKPLADDAELTLGRVTGGTDLSRGMRYKLGARRALRAAGKQTDRQHLEVVMVDGRAAVVFSSLDLSAATAGVEVFRAEGYKSRSARQVFTNVLALAAKR